MASVVIYTKSWCGFCRRAKQLLDARGVDYTEIDVGEDPALEREMIQKSGGCWTVPQVFIDGAFVGGSRELLALDGDGRLDALLNGNQRHGNV